MSGRRWLTRSGPLVREALGRRAFFMGPGRDLPLLEGLDIELAVTPAEADFVLNVGADEAIDRSGGRAASAGA